jgi:hypothetical protein
MGKTVVGLTLLCALILSALGVPSALAAGGPTLVTCKKGGTTLDFRRAHCASADKVPALTGEFSHFKVENGVATTLTGTNAATKNETKEAEHVDLTSTIAGVEIETTCTTAAMTGEAENREPSNETHEIVGRNIVITFSGCTMPKPAGQECKVKEGKITTNSLKFASIEDWVVLTPTTGTTLWTKTIEGCKTGALNGAKNATGSIKAVPNGATWAVNITKNAESTVEFGGQKAGLLFSLTVRGKKVGGSEVAEPLSVTTTPLVLGG